MSCWIALSSNAPVNSIRIAPKRTRAYAAKPLWISVSRFLTLATSLRRIRSRGEAQSSTWIGVRNHAPSPADLYS